MIGHRAKPEENVNIVMHEDNYMESKQAHEDVVNYAVKTYTVFILQHNNTGHFK